MLLCCHSRWLCPSSLHAPILMHSPLLLLQPPSLLLSLTPNLSNLSPNSHPPTPHPSNSPLPQPSPPPLKPLALLCFAMHLILFVCFVRSCIELNLCDKLLPGKLETLDKYIWDVWSGFSSIFFNKSRKFNIFGRSSLVFSQFSFGY